jgi:hypothetical protein
MSGVILRCPHCGTTAAATGECAACHESAVRYQCTNHTPGRWLDAPSCPDCGAAFGVAAPRPAAPARPPRVEAEPVDVGMPPSRRSRGPVGPTLGAEPWGHGPAPRDESARDAHAEMAEAHRRLEELLGTSARRPARDPREPAAARVPGVGGCLFRLFFMLALLFLFLFAGPLLFGLSLLQMFRS